MIIRNLKLTKWSWILSRSTKRFAYICLALFLTIPVFSQTTTTNTSLTEPTHIKEFIDATNRLRCICLPSLPIQGCSYNMCIVSSYLKTFIENKVREGMTADEIVLKFETGFGDAILQDPKDPVILHFEKEGNRGMINSLVNGFGKNIQAKPDSTWINLSLGLIGIFSLIGIGYYLKQRKKKIESKTEGKDSKDDMDNLEKKYLSEI
ncbi:MAG: cytochrome C biogenesis protein [Leptospira sp.]|nr:cytochrome C biogenesis protein [Leptospira sp.]